MMNEKEQRLALFWCSLLRPLIFEEVAGEELTRRLKEIAGQEVTFPNGKHKKPSLSTLRRKWKGWQEGGLEGLLRKPRGDRGKLRKGRQEMMDLAVELKKDQPLRSEETINQFLQQRFGKTLPKATLYRHLKQAGATRVKLGVAKTKVRCRWTRDQTNALWLGDFEDGPFVFDPQQGRPVRTHLSAFIDCHSRYVVSGHYYRAQHFNILIDSLLRAWSVHGASRELYLDNAKIYHADALKAACYQLNVKLLHRPARDPAPGGLIERFFRTCQSQFEAEVRAAEILTLDELNRVFAAWLEVSYHQRTHAEIGQSPHARYHAGRPFIRHVNLEKVSQLFYRRVPRTVDKIYCDVRVENAFFRVQDRRLRGDEVEVRYDPYAPLERVSLYSSQGVYLGQALRYEREKGAHGEEPPAPPPTKPKHDYLQLLRERHETSMSQRSQDTDHRELAPPEPWPFVEFAGTLAALLGRRGGLSAFDTDELETLEKLYQRVACDEALLRQAAAQAAEKTLPGIASQLLRLDSERNR
jgi:transposase InsO family protein